MGIVPLWFFSRNGHLDFGGKRLCPYLDNYEENSQCKRVWNIVWHQQNYHF